MKTGTITKRDGLATYELKCAIPLGRISPHDEAQWQTQLADAFRVLREGRRTDTQAALRKSAKRLNALADMLDGRMVADTLLADSWAAFAASPARTDCSRETLANYERVWRGFVEFAVAAGLVTCGDITERLARDYLATLAVKGLAASTYNGIIGALRMVYAVLCPDSPDPWRAVSKHRGVPRRTRPLTPDEITRLLEVAEGESLTLCMIAAYTGLRFGDCCCLRTDNVDFGAGTVTIAPAKTRRRRPEPVVIPLHPALRARLWSVTPERAHFTPVAAREYTAGRRDAPLRRVMRDFRKAAIRGNENERVGFHSLRYSFVTALANAGVPLAQIGEMVSHATVKQTQRYFKPGMDAKRDAVMALPDVGGDTSSGLRLLQASKPEIETEMEVLSA